MKCQTNQYKLQYFSQITDTEYQCFVCLHKIIIALEQSIEQQLNEHLLSNDHLISQYQILIQLGCVDKTTQECNLKTLNEKKQKLFHLQKAKDFKKKSKELLNGYFEKCLQKTNCVINKRLTTQKTYIIVLKRFYNFILDQGSDWIQENFIIQFLKQEQFKQNSISAIKFLTKSLCQPLTAELLEKISQFRDDQSKIDKEKADERFNLCKEFFFYLFQSSQQRFVLMILLLFELDIDIQVIPELKYEDVLNEKILMFRNTSKKSNQICLIVHEQIRQLIDIFVRKFQLDKSSFILPEIRNMRDLQSLLNQIKHDFESHKQKMKKSLAQFIQGFSLSSIKYIKRNLLDQQKNRIHNDNVKELLFPDLFHFFIKLLQDEIKSTKNENITNSNVCSQFKRSKSQLQLQRHKNNIQMISHSHNIIALEDCSEEYNQSQLNNQAQDNVSKSNLCLEDKLSLETKNSDQLQY